MVEIAMDIQSLKAKLETVKSLIGKTPTYTGWRLQDSYPFQGLQISIENKKGSLRKWKNRKGEEGETKMLYDYGYIKRTLGKDGDHVDCYIKDPDSESKRVFIIHQQIDGKFDEDKVMLGWDDKEEAKQAYLAHYDDKDYYGGMDEMSLEDFKEKVIGKECKGKITKADIEEFAEMIKSLRDILYGENGL